MFLESDYIPEYKARVSNLRIADIAVLVAQLGDKPYLRCGSPDHLTAGDIQLVCYFTQGFNIVRNGISLFNDDFYVTHNRIESPVISRLFGGWNRVVTPFELSSAIEAEMTRFNSSFNAENNALVRELAFALVPKNTKQILAYLRTTEPYKNALKDEMNRISKADIKEFFNELILKKDNVDKSWSIHEAPIFLKEETFSEEA